MSAPNVTSSAQELLELSERIKKKNEYLLSLVWILLENEDKGVRLGNEAEGELKVLGEQFVEAFRKCTYEEGEEFAGLDQLTKDNILHSVCNCRLPNNLELELAESLLRVGADPKMPESEIDFLMSAIYEPDLKMVRLILQYRPDMIQEKYLWEATMCYSRYSNPSDEDYNLVEAKEYAAIALTLISYGARYNSEDNPPKIPSELAIELLKENPDLITPELAKSTVVYDNVLGQKIFSNICDKIYDDGMFDIFLKFAENGAEFEESCVKSLHEKCSLGYEGRQSKKFIIPTMIACGVESKVITEFLPKLKSNEERLLCQVAYAIKRSDPAFKTTFLDMICDENNLEILKERFKDFDWKSDKKYDNAIEVLNGIRESRVSSVAVPGGASLLGGSGIAHGGAGGRVA